MFLCREQLDEASHALEALLSQHRRQILIGEQRNHHRNIIGRETFDDDSFASQSRFDAYALAT